MRSYSILANSMCELRSLSLIHRRVLHCDFRADFDSNRFGRNLCIFVGSLGAFVCEHGHRWLLIRVPWGIATLVRASQTHSMAESSTTVCDATSKSLNETAVVAINGGHFFGSDSR
jgi:hypothetical protein